MRRADGDAAAGPVGISIRRAAVMTAFVLMAMAPAGARGDGPAPGQRVVARADRLTLRDDRGAVAGVGGKGQVYRVERIDGRRLWLRGEGTELGGWAAADAVVAVAPLADPSVRQADARPHRGVGSVLGGPVPAYQVRRRTAPRLCRGEPAGPRPGDRRVHRGDPASIPVGPRPIPIAPPCGG